MGEYVRAVVQRPKVHRDSRGYLFEVYRGDMYRQCNVLNAKKGSLRGMHFRTCMTQAKLVTCLSGLVYDVSVNLNPGKDFGKWEGVWLDPVLNAQVFVPPGFAHGVYAPQESILMYHSTTEFDESLERVLSFNDPDVNIHWPESTTLEVSVKDLRGVSLNEAKEMLIYQSTP